MMLSVQDVANKLGVTKGTMSKWISGKKHCGPWFKKVGRSPMMTEEDFNDFVKSLPYVGGAHKPEGVL